MAQAKSESSTSRRSFLSAASVAAIVVPMGKEAAAQTPDWLAMIEKAFDDAQAALDAHCFMHRDSDQDSPEYEELFGRVRTIVQHIKWMKATDIRGFRLKARAVLWCNTELTHLEGKSTDHELTRSIVEQLLSLPSV